MRSNLAAAVLLLGMVAGGCEQQPSHPGPEISEKSPRNTPPPPDEFSSRREQMVRELSLVVKDRRVLDAMRRVPRHDFIPPSHRSRSYVSNTPLPIGEDQTISAPDIVAIMTEALALEGNERVLEIGTGSRYQAAVLGALAAEVYSVEVRPALAESARKRLKNLRERGILSYRKLEVIVGDGFMGYRDAAPYDRIIVTAAPRQVPTELINQLKPGGRMVIPVGDFYQELQLITKNEDGPRTWTRCGSCRWCRRMR